MDGWMDVGRQLRWENRGKTPLSVCWPARPTDMKKHLRIVCTHKPIQLNWEGRTYAYAVTGPSIHPYD